jgi:hypothetical protein
MLTRGDHSLVEAGDIASLHDAAFTPSERAALRETLDWTRSYLCAPHGDLGRPGPVCPFTRPALERHGVWLTTDPSPTIDLQTTPARLLAYRDWFVELAPPSTTASQYATIIMVFPGLLPDTSPTALDELQRELKPAFVRDGLMIGQFYPTCDEAGLWNPEFRPLRSPVPLLAIRWMVPSDFPFLTGHADHVGPYLARYASELPTKVRKTIARSVVRS